MTGTRLPHTGRFSMDHLNEPAVFWGELSPCQHLVQIYEKDTVFLDCLEGFVRGGIEDDEAVIVIATDEHRRALERRLARTGIDLDVARRENRYIDLDAEATLAEFMMEGWPDDGKFQQLVSNLMTRARSGGRPVRAFGEMVALLWGRGHNGATIRLEHLWHTLCLAQGFSLFCAYPKSGFTQDAAASIREICETHSQVRIG
jgi:hypothetical protein